jgi:hypothetical protein
MPVTEPTEQRTRTADEGGTRREPVPVETIEEAAEDEQEQEEIRGRGQTRRGLDN